MADQLSPPKLPWQLGRSRDHQARTPHGEFAHLAYVAYLFALRVQSAALPIRPDHISDPLEVFTHQRGGISRIGEMPSGGKSLSASTPSQELTGRLRTYSPLFFSIQSVTPIQRTPFIFIEMDLLARPLRHAPFLSYARRNINPVLKRVCGKIGLPGASRYRSHASRRGAAQELKEKGAQWPTIATMGEWRSLAICGYVDIADDIARDTPKLFADDVACASDEDEQVPLWPILPIFLPRLELGIIGC